MTFDLNDRMAQAAQGAGEPDAPAAPDRIRHAQADGIAEGATSPLRRRVEPHAVLQLGLRTQSRLEHSGRTASASARSRAYTRGAARRRVSRSDSMSESTPARGRLARCLNYLERTAYFILQLGEVCLQQRLFGVDDHIDSSCRGRKIQPDRLTQATLHSIPLYSSAERPADSKTYPLGSLLAPQVEHRHMGRKIAAALLVNALEVSMAKQAHAARKLPFPG